MEMRAVIVIAVVVVLVVAGLFWLYMQRRKTAALRLKFGSEYNRAVLVHGSERKAEAKLADREKRVEKLTIRDLDASEHERFAKRWEDVQARFVDSPKGAVLEADDLVTALMKTRGYPVSDFDQRAADISVDHPKVVENYRSAHETTTRVGKLEATTDELRGAMIHYRALYEELMQNTSPKLVKAAS
jgi:preprotein translocase subunit SecF